MIQAALFSKFPGDFVGATTKRLEPYGVKVARVFDFERMRRRPISLAGFDAVLFMNEMAGPGDRGKVKDLADVAGKPFIMLTRKEAHWEKLLKPLIAPANSTEPSEQRLVQVVKRRPMGPILTKSITPIQESVPAEEPPPLAIVAPPRLEEIVPPVPASSGMLPEGETKEISKLFEDENAELRRLIKNQEEIINRQGARIVQQDAALKALGVLVKSPPPDDWRQAASHIRALVTLGIMDGLQGIDLLAGNLGLA